LKIRNVANTNFAPTIVPLGSANHLYRKNVELGIAYPAVPLPFLPEA